MKENYVIYNKNMKVNLLRYTERLNSSNEKRRLTIVLNLIIEERQKVNRQKYKPV